MTSDEIIRMAREAGFADGVAEIVGLAGFANFANLVAAAEPVAWNATGVAPMYPTQKEGETFSVSYTTTPQQQPVFDCPRCGHVCSQRPWVDLTEEEVRFYTEKHRALVNAHYDKVADTNIMTEAFDSTGFYKEVSAVLKDRNT